MRLILDEHFHRRIAQQLRDRGHDVVTVAEQGLRGSPDEDLLATAAGLGRALVTNNVADFVGLERRWAAEGLTHAGIIYTSDASLSRGADGIGEAVRRLERELANRPAEDALRNTSVWLSQRPPG